MNEGVKQLAACRTRLLCTLPTFATELSGLAVPVIVSDIHQLVLPSGSGTGTKPSAVTQSRPACPRFWYEAWYWLGFVKLWPQIWVGGGDQDPIPALRVCVRALFTATV